jgi:hypothetical protein
MLFFNDTKKKSERMKMHSFKNKHGKEIDYMLKVYTRPNLRDGTHEMLLYVGKSILDNIFDKKQIDEKTTSVGLYYPETWCNIPELQCLLNFIVYFYPNLEELTITTHSVYIIQNTRREQCGIYDDVSKYEMANATPMTHFCASPEAFKGLWANGKRIN